MTTQYDHPRYVKHVLRRIYVFFTLFGHGVHGGGVPRDWYTTCLCNFSHWAAQKSQFSKLFFYILITQDDPPSHVKQVLGRIYVVFTLFVY